MNHSRCLWFRQRVQQPVLHSSTFPARLAPCHGRSLARFGALYSTHDASTRVEPVVVARSGVPRAVEQPNLAAWHDLLSGDTCGYLQWTAPARALVAKRLSGARLKNPKKV